MRELLARIDSRELSEWQAYEGLDPWGGWRGDLQAGIVASVVANTMGRRKGQPAFTPQDFLPSFEGPSPRPAQTVEEQMQMARLITDAFNRARRH